MNPMTVADRVTMILANTAHRTYLCSVSGGGSNSADSTLQHGHSIFEDGIRWITHSRVDIPRTGPCKLGCSICGIGEVVCAGLVERYGARSVDGVRLLTTMKGNGREMWRPDSFFVKMVLL